MTRPVGLLLVVLGGQIGGHRETRFKLHNLCRMRGGRNAVAHLREGCGEERVMREVVDPRNLPVMLLGTKHKSQTHNQGP